MKLRALQVKGIHFLRNLESLKHNIRKFYLDYLRTSGRFIYTASGIISFFILIFEYGFYYPESWVPYVRLSVVSLVNFFLFYELISFLFSSQKAIVYIKEHRLQFIILLLILIEKLFKDDILKMLSTYHLTGNDTTLIFLSTNQILFIFANLAHFYRVSRYYNAKNINPSFVFILSFAAIIGLGSLFLHFPKATYGKVTSLDIIFTAVSATCVTGLSTITINEEFTLTGQLIILVMIQVGGLGLMTLTSFFSFILAGQSSVNDKLLLKDLLSEESIGKVKSILKQIGYQTLIIEFFGALLLYTSFPKESTLLESEKIYYSIFHSISAFCNAGFSLMPAGLSDPLFARNQFFLSTIMLLIVFGGLGFPVISQLRRWIFRPKDKSFRFSITSRLVLSTSIILWLFGGISYYYLESQLTLKDLSIQEKVFHSLFYSVTTRTAGFNTLDLTQMGMPITFISFFLMWVGASPISTGGGIKTTTLAISVINIINQIRGKENLEIHHRLIAPSTIARASASIVLSLFVIFGAILALITFEKAPFIDLCFEVVSAFGTVGLSRGLTPILSSNSKIVLCIVMFVGRVGILTLLIAITKRAKSYAYKYPIEYVVVG
ncbi:MAG: potassium transporter TrkG [Leptospira sp.]|nr:potassium transporter TrkG [Leptospira sp.]